MKVNLVSRIGSLAMMRAASGNLKSATRGMECGLYLNAKQTPAALDDEVIGKAVTVRLADREIETGSFDSEY